VSIRDLLYLVFGMGERDELPRLSPDRLDRLRTTGDGPAVIYKHSPRCMICRRAIGEVEDFARSRSDIPVYRIDVLEQRELSDRVARELDVRHESPQVIVLRDGRPRWSASHGAVTAEALSQAIGGDGDVR